MTMTMTPVPRRPRVDGWTPDRQRAFLAALAELRSVSKAAACVQMTARSAYRLRQHPAAGDFRAAWEAALVDVPRARRPSLLERAMDGDTLHFELDGVRHTRRVALDVKTMLRLLARAERFAIASAGRSRLAGETGQNTTLCDLPQPGPITTRPPPARPETPDGPGAPIRNDGPALHRKISAERDRLGSIPSRT